MPGHQPPPLPQLPEYATWIPLRSPVWKFHNKGAHARRAALCKPRSQVWKLAGFVGEQPNWVLEWDLDQRCDVAHCARMSTNWYTSDLVYVTSHGETDDCLELLTHPDLVKYCYTHRIPLSPGQMFTDKASFLQKLKETADWEDLPDGFEEADFA